MTAAAVVSDPVGSGTGSPGQAPGSPDGVAPGDKAGDNGCGQAVCVGQAAGIPLLPPGPVS